MRDKIEKCVAWFILFLVACWKRVTGGLSRYILKLNLKDAMALAKRRHELTGSKMWVVLIRGQYVSLSKKEFKVLWHKNPAMKFRNIQQWQKHVYELTGDSEYDNTTIRKNKSS